MADPTADMPGLLRQFFIQHRQVSIPGVGSFQLLREPARLDVAARQMKAPGYRIQFDSLQDNPTREQFDYISRKTLVDEWEAIGMLNAFAMGLKDRLRTGKKYIWQGVGTLEAIPGGQLILSPADMDHDFLPDLPAVPVIRKDASHTVRVGETELSSEEARQWLEEDVVVARAGWWVAASVIAAIALGLVFFRYFTNSYSFVSGNQSVITTSAAPQQYQENKAR